MMYLSRHIHVSVRDNDGGNIFAVGKEDLKEGRPDAAFKDTRWISAEAESFLAGILEGIADGTHISSSISLLFIDTDT